MCYTEGSVWLPVLDTAVCTRPSQTTGDLVRGSPGTLRLLQKIWDFLTILEQRLANFFNETPDGKYF